MIPGDNMGNGWVYLNGQIVPLREACISPLDRGFQFGDGVFTTLRAESGQILYLREHLARMSHSLADLRIPAEALHSLDWPKIVGELLVRNGLLAGPAAMKILVTRGIAPLLGLPEAAPPTVFIQTRPYQAPSPDQYSLGWRLMIYRQGYAPPLARHKSLNYLYYLMARQAALDAGADEAVILDVDGHVAETAAGSLLIRTAGNWWTPGSAHRLPGVTLAQLERMLSDRGQSMRVQHAAPEDLAGADTIWVLNSLLGIMPVRSVDGGELPQVAGEEARMLREELLARGKH